MFAALVAQVPDLPGLGEEGPDDLRSLLTVCFVLLFAGFVLGALGHLSRSRALVAIGVTTVMVGTGVFVVAIARYG